MTPGAMSILTDYAGGNRGADLNPDSVQQQVAAFLAGLESVYPGVANAAVKNGVQFVAHLEHWPSNPLSQGAYTCYRLGQFTSVAGLEGQAAGRLNGLFLLVARIHGGGMPVGNTRGGRDRRRYPRGRV